jgi:hypothetical protein
MKLSEYFAKKFDFIVENFAMYSHVLLTVQYMKK